MKAWIEKIARLACEKKLADFQSVLTHFDRKVGDIQSQVDKLNQRLDAIDETILSMTKNDLDKFMTNRLVMFEGSIDDKIVGLFRTVDEKISNGNGNVKATTSLLRRIAVLEGIKDAVEHRRPTGELIERLEGYRKQLLQLDRTDGSYSRYQDAINILNWVLGESDG